MTIAVLGGGPAGLGAAYALATAGVDVTVFESGPEPGGLARSFDLWGTRVELGAHLLQRTDPRIDRLWTEVVGDGYHAVPRQTAVAIGGRRYRYPYEPLDVVRTLGPAGTIRCGASLARQRLRRRAHAREDDLEGWVTARFGGAAFELFFAPYVEKLLGLPAHELDPSFAGSLVGFQGRGGPATMLWASLTRRRSADVGQAPVVRPHDGVGGLLTRLARHVEQRGGRVLCGAPVRRLVLDGSRVTGVHGPDGVVAVDHVIATLPLPNVVGGLVEAPDAVVEPLRTMATRSAVVVYLRVRGESSFDGQWLFETSAEYRTCRVTNYAGFVPRAARGDDTIMSGELWCDFGDDVWCTADDALADLVAGELGQMGLVSPRSVSDTHVVRVARAFPVLRRGHRRHVARATEHLLGLGGITVTGRWGAFANTGVHESLLLGMEEAEAVLAARGS